jgi:uncharacterized protein
MHELWQEARSGFARMAPSRLSYPRLALAMVIGVIGGWLFVQARLPLPWMLGPMTLCTLAAILRAPVAAPSVIRAPMTIVIGVLLGGAFSPDLARQALGWFPTIAGLIVFMVACGIACTALFRHVGGFDRTTAFFAGMPGGLVEMVIVGESKGGNGEMIALVQSARILLVVMILPFIVQWFEGVPLGGGRPTGVSLLDTPLSSEFWLVACGLIGIYVGHVFNLPAKLLLGPMFVSAFVHAIGLSSFKLPTEIVIIAQLVLGVTLGCRFANTQPKEIGRVLLLSLGSTGILLLLTILSAVLVAKVSNYGVVPLMLAYSPGGLAEMSLIALAINVEVAFVAAHHIIRIVLVMVGAGPLFGLISGKAGTIPDESSESSSD